MVLIILLFLVQGRSKVYVTLYATARNDWKIIFNWVIFFFALLYYILVHFMMRIQFIDNMQGYQKCSIHPFLPNVVTGSISPKIEIKAIKCKLCIGYYGCITVCRLCMLWFLINIQNMFWTSQYTFVTTRQSQRGILKGSLRA